MQPELITYRKFNDIALANALAEQLTEHDITYIIEEQSSTFDPGFRLNDELSTDYAVKISPDDFARVNALLIEDESKMTDEVDADYYLLSFTDDELTDVIAKADEWSTFDVVLAQKLLAERGVTISDHKIEELHEQRIEELKKPDEPQTFWIILGYILILFAGVLGIFIGWHTAYHKKTLPNGEKVFSYSENDRKHGRIIFRLSVVTFVIALLWKLYLVFREPSY